MTISGKIIRSAAGKLERSHDGRLKRCGCGCVGASCGTVIAAKPCSEVLVGDCERALPYVRWICTDTVCDETGTPVGADGGQVVWIPDEAIDGGGYCAKTDGSMVRAFSSLTSGEQATVIGAGGILCLAAGCDDERCGSVQDVCACVCSAGDPDDATYCCLGKLGPYVDGVQHVCWDWSVAGTEVVELTRTKMRGGPIGCPGNISRGCQQSDACTVFRREYSFLDDGKDICEHDVGCCIPKQGTSRITLSRTCSADDTCGLRVNPFGCDCPNIGDGTWVNAWGSFSGFADDGDLSVCVPENTGTTTTVIELSGADDFDGCHGQITRTITETHNCSGSEYTVVDEEWSYWRDACDDGAGPFDCCLCQIYQKTTLHLVFSISAPNAGDVECGQCASTLAG